MTTRYGFTHIIIALLVILLAAVGILVYFSITKSGGGQSAQTQDQSERQIETVAQSETQYANPFDQNTQYENPFNESTNPFDNL